jgi:hypothetical protein
MASLENGAGHLSNEIKMVFRGLTIASMSFDFEIFPDNTCRSLTHRGGQGCPNPPDLTVASNGSHEVAEYDEW